MSNLKDISQGVMIGFSANKTEAEAQANAAAINNRMVICRTKQLYLNGERLGITDAESDYLKKKLNEENNARLQLQQSTSPSIVDKHDGTNVTVVFKTLWDNVYVTPDSIKVLDSSNKEIALTESTQATGAKQFTAKLNKNEKYTATVTHKGVTKTIASNQINAYYSVYYGVSSNDTINAVTGLTKKAASSSASGTYAFTFANGQYAYILIPSGVAMGKLGTPDKENVYHASEGVSDVPFIKQSTNVTYNGATYEVFRLASAQSVSSHDITI